MTTSQIIDGAIAALAPTFAQTDLQVKHNLSRVLDAYRAHKVGAHHFASVSGYGHDDLGRQVLDRAFAQIVGAESAIVRVQFVSGTHAIACCLFGILRPGDELLSVAGAPYDTLEEVIGYPLSKRQEAHGDKPPLAPSPSPLASSPSPLASSPSPLASSPSPLASNGSLKDFGIRYRQVDLAPNGEIDWQALATAVRPGTRMVSIQRSCGYDWRPSLAIADIARIVQMVKQQNPDTVCFVDNCYGEFVDTCEPTAVGADLMAGSLIKNPGGTIVTAGGYVAGRAPYVEAAARRLTAPGIGSAGGATFDLHRLMFQGLFLAPQMVGEAMKGNHLAACVFDKLGYKVNPLPFTPRRDVIQAIELGSPEKLIKLCRAIQQRSPVDSYVDPVPGNMPGYVSQLVMAGGTFIDGSTSELSADGPLRPPYIAFLQGGTHWTHVAIALENLDL